MNAILTIDLKKEFHVKLDQLLRERREQKGWTQKQLAELAGVSPGFINKVEAGETLPGEILCITLTKVIGIPEEEFMKAREQSQVERSQQRARVRTEATWQALATRGNSASTSHSQSVEKDLEVVEGTTPEEETAFKNLRIALAHPQVRPKVLAALEAYASAASALSE